MRRTAGAADRNKEPILEVLRTLLPLEARVLEIASGAGQHAVHLAGALPGVHWQPTDIDPDALDSIADWVAHTGLRNVAAPRRLDVHDEDWGVEGPFDLVFCANMIHIAPASAWPALVRGAWRRLVPGGVLALYGPFYVGGDAVDSNRAFDARLQAQDPDWGVRELEDVQTLAAATGFGCEPPIAMPANNLVVPLRRPR